MSDRFDREASLAVKAGLACARRLGAAEVGGEHLLVGICAVPSPAAATMARLGVEAPRLEEAVSRGAHDARLLAGLGIDLAAVQRQLGDRLTARWRTPRPRFRTDTRQALVASLREKRALGTRRIRGEHLVLGLLESSVAVRELLLALDIDPIQLRRALLGSLSGAG